MLASMWLSHQVPARTVSALERCPVGSSAGEEPSGPALFEKTENIGA